VDTLETTTDADGGFRFDGLDADASLEYWPEVVYLDVAYTSAEPVQFDGGELALAATVTVYETTDDDSAVYLNSIHFIAESFGEVLRISEIHLLGNSGDRTYVGSAGEANPPTAVYIPLPENGVGLALEQEESAGRYVEVEGGVMDTEPVPPGPDTSMTFFSYHLLVTGETIPLERHFSYPVSTLSVLVAQPGLNLNSDQLEARGPESFQGRQYEFYVTQDLAADTPLIMGLTPVEDTSGAGQAPAMPAGDQAAARVASTRGNQELLRWLGFALAGLAVFGAIVYALTPRRSSGLAGKRSVTASGPDLVRNPKARQLLADLADLDDAFEAGQVDEASYEQQRVEIYEALKSLTP
jgi:hypothetical protein